MSDILTPLTPSFEALVYTPQIATFSNDHAEIRLPCLDTSLLKPTQ